MTNDVEDDEAIIQQNKPKKTTSTKVHSTNMRKASQLGTTPGNKSTNAFKNQAIENSQSNF